ncbi:hypothetical protein BGZ70_002484 [Mortierella alpina]|uniref:Uncharacterized protein n=1 Tax=Mortierella alpina TaxID=64518 RepID=A0A9P6IUF9_MORAP|nr:hypothetical protein BGZ70_002484 [Mortierella alpina]
MDAVRAKVLRNAGQTQQQREQQQQQHQHLHKKTSADFNARRKAYSQNSGSPERLKRHMEGFPTPRTAASPNSATSAITPKLRNGSTATTTTSTTSPSTRAVDVKQENALPLARSPISPSSSPSTNGERGHSGSARSGSVSPLPTLSAEEGPGSANGERKAGAEGRSKSPMRPQVSNECATDEAEEEKTSRYRLDRSRSERATDIGVLVN